jgi:hypothetical protein
MWSLGDVAPAHLSRLPHLSAMTHEPLECTPPSSLDDTSSFTCLRTVHPPGLSSHARTS